MMTTVPIDASRWGVVDIASAGVAGRRVLVRADLNVPITDGRIADTSRIDRFLPTVGNLLAREAAVIVMSHLGRPKRVPDPQWSLAPVAEEMARRLPVSVNFIDEELGAASLQAADTVRPGNLALLENLRFHAGEEQDDAEFAARLAEHGELYVNDAFACSHRAHASLHAITRCLPSYAGGSLLKELDMLSRILDSPARPTMAVVGGAKVSSKIALLEHLLQKVDCLAVGGAMANTFLAAQGMDVGSSLYEPDFMDMANTIADGAMEQQCELLLPTDVVVAAALEAGADHQVCPVASIPTDGIVVDLGPETVQRIGTQVEQSRAVLWNGPLGAFEMEPFDQATVAVAHRVAAATTAGQVTSVAGGGDTLAALNKANVTEEFTYVSTAGGAFLEWVEGRELPGIVALRNAQAQDGASDAKAS